MARTVEVERTPRMRDKFCRDLVSNLQRHSPNDLCKDLSAVHLKIYPKSDD